MRGLPDRKRTERSSGMAVSFFITASAHVKSLRDGADARSHYVYIRSAQ